MNVEGCNGRRRRPECKTDVQFTSLVCIARQRRCPKFVYRVVVYNKTRAVEIRARIDTNDAEDYCHGRKWASKQTAEY